MTREEIQSRLEAYPQKPLPPFYGAAVILPLFEENGEIKILFEVRAKQLTKQPGESCFPGGKLEAGEDVETGAIREMGEEIGISKEHIHIFGQLEPARHSSGQFIAVCPAWVDTVEELHLQEEEVDSVFSVPLQWLLGHPPKYATYTLTPDMENAPEELIPFLPHYRQTRTTPIWVYEGHVIWGMTARSLTEFLKKLRY
jgi:8-oxo-dGTP pyrophosphatase MutT (NUDIX family)